MNLLTAFLRLLSRLPLRALYVLSTLCFPFVYHIFRYRRKVVRGNIDRSFPELSEKRRRLIELRFYLFFCDYVVETLKLLTISPEEMRQRMKVEGMEEVEESLKSHPFVFLYLGHYCNWEWISSIPLWCKEETTHCAQLYRPLKDKWSDALFMEMRTRFGAENISKYDALRRILALKKEGRPTVIGFISDQSPTPNNIHAWVDFLHQDTPVVTGTERIARKVNAAIYFADVKRVKRGYYRLHIRPMTCDVNSLPEYRLTELYMKELEEMIRRQPSLWLWTHKRWKHRREEKN